MGTTLRPKDERTAAGSGKKVCFQNVIVRILSLVLSLLIYHFLL